MASTETALLGFIQSHRTPSPRINLSPRLNLDQEFILIKGCLDQCVGGEDIGALHPPPMCLADCFSVLPVGQDDTRPDNIFHG